MITSTLFHYGGNSISRRAFEEKLLRKLAGQYGLELETVWPACPHVEFVKAVKKAKYARLISLWNGSLCCGPLFTRLCKEKKIPRCYLEWGMLPQESHIFFDPLGFAGDSIMNHDVSWVTQDDLDNLARKRQELQGWYELEDEGYIIVPLQKENDTQILYHTPYMSMDEFVEDVIRLYPRNKIVVKPHPKDEAIQEFMARWSGDNRVSIAPAYADFLRLASKASLVVGLTSTTLYEAGILGKPVISLARHPLSMHSPHDKEHVLAAALALNLDSTTGDLKPLLDRFDIKPRIY
jgi:hypothetical protein